MATKDKQFLPRPAFISIITTLFASGVIVLASKDMIHSFGYGLLIAAGIIAFVQFWAWRPIKKLYALLAFVKIEVQGSGLRGVYPPLPYNIIYGEMALLEVKFKLSSRLKLRLESSSLHIDKNVFISRGFCQEEGRISGAMFEIPVSWFRGKSRKAYIIVSAKGREWCSKEFEIKVDY